MKGHAIILTTTLAVGGFALWSIHSGSKKFEELEKRNALCYHMPTTIQETPTIDRQSIDQVFRDYNGWRVYSHDETGRVREQFFVGGRSYETHREALRQVRDRADMYPFDIATSKGVFKALNSDSDFVIFKDLPEGEQPHLNRLEYLVTNCETRFEHIEVHLPVTQGVAPGIDYNNQPKRSPAHPLMQEVR